MIHGSIYTDRRNFNFDDVEPGFECATPECHEASWDLEDFKQCEVCQARFCPDHLVKFEDLLFCKDCAKCHCRDSAVAICLECGSLVCREHSNPQGLKGRLCVPCAHPKTRCA